MIKVVAKNKEHLRQLVEKNIKHFGLNCDLNYIDVSQVTDITYLFGQSKFTGDISKWDVSNVTNMRAMFWHSKFNSDISQWNVSNVTDMSEMFKHSKFNQDISHWNISSGLQKYLMFDMCELEKNNNLPEWF